MMAFLKWLVGERACNRLITAKMYVPSKMGCSKFLLACGLFVFEVVINTI
jgi:hypothetical protein